MTDHPHHPARGLPPRGAGLPAELLDAPGMALQVCTELRVVEGGQPTADDGIERYGAEQPLDGTVTLEQARRRLLGLQARTLAANAVRHDAPVDPALRAKLDYARSLAVWPAHLTDALLARARVEGRDPAEVVVDAVREYLDRVIEEGYRTPGHLVGERGPERRAEGWSATLACPTCGRQPGEGCRCG